MVNWMVWYSRLRAPSNATTAAIKENNGENIVDGKSLNWQQSNTMTTTINQHQKPWNAKWRYYFTIVASICQIGQLITHRTSYTTCTMFLSVQDARARANASRDEQISVIFLIPFRSIFCCLLCVQSHAKIIIIADGSSVCRFCAIFTHSVNNFLYYWEFDLLATICVANSHSSHSIRIVYLSDVKLIEQIILLLRLSDRSCRANTYMVA